MSELHHAGPNTVHPQPHRRPGTTEPGTAESTDNSPPPTADDSSRTLTKSRDGDPPDPSR